MNITLQQAETAVDAAVAKAQEMNVKMNIAIVDSGANLVAFARMDGAWVGSIDIAWKKAKTSAWFMMDTADLTQLVKPDGPLFNIEHSNGGLITFPGGIAIKGGDGTVIGAIGVSGSTVDDDHKVAETGVKALSN